MRNSKINVAMSHHYLPACPLKETDRWTAYHYVWHEPEPSATISLFHFFCHGLLVLPHRAGRGGREILRKAVKKKIPWQVSIQIHFSLALLVMQQCNNVPLRYWRKKQKSITGLVFRRFGIPCGEVERTDSKQTSESMCLSGFIDCCDQPQGYTLNKTCFTSK